jgi:hypothetical protein
MAGGLSTRQLLYRFTPDQKPQVTKMRLKLLGSSFMFIIAASYFNYPRAITSGIVSAPCVVGRTAAPVGFWTWPAGTHVSVYLREPDFEVGDIAAVNVALQNWDAAAVEDGSLVHFSFRGLTRETKTAQGNMTLIRGAIYQKKVRHLALLEAHSLSNNQLIDYALVIVDITVKDPEVLTNVMAHEIGHSLGLLDCYHCRGGSTAMGLLKSADESNGIEGPTTCDKTAVLSAYEKLSLHVAASPAALQSVEAMDQGEEPEEDDTPIISGPIAPAVPQAGKSNMPSAPVIGPRKRPQ